MAGTMSKIISELDDVTLDAVLQDGDEFEGNGFVSHDAPLRQVTLNAMKQILGPLVEDGTMSMWMELVVKVGWREKATRLERRLHGDVKAVQLHYPVSTNGAVVGVDDSCCIVIDARGRSTITVTNVEDLVDALHLAQAFVPVVRHPLQES